MTKKIKNGPKEQLKIAGTERKDRIPALDELAEEYRNTRDARMGMQVDESELKERLEALCAEHKRERYVYEGADGEPYEVVVGATEVTVSVRKLKRRQDTDA